MEKSLASHMPTHLVYYEWEADADKILAQAKAKGAPTYLLGHLKKHILTRTFEKTHTYHDVQKNTYLQI